MNAEVKLAATPNHQQATFNLQLLMKLTPKSIANPIASWSAAGSEAPRRFHPHDNFPNFRKRYVRTKAVSRLCLATALQDASRILGIVANAEAFGITTP
jgi:hypothetical protein